MDQIGIGRYVAKYLQTLSRLPGSVRSPVLQGLPTTWADTFILARTCDDANEGQVCPRDLRIKVVTECFQRRLNLLSPHTGLHLGHPDNPTVLQTGEPANDDHRGNEHPDGRVPGQSQFSKTPHAPKVYNRLRSPLNEGKESWETSYMDLTTV
jgi:hypothetical protein